MPAMSRQTVSGARRSAMVFAGSPSKSMIFQPAGVCSVCPRWKSPCTRCVSRVSAPRWSKHRSSPGMCGASAGAISAASCRRSIMIIAVRVPSTFVVGKGRAQGVVGLGERLAERLSLRREA